MVTGIFVGVFIVEVALTEATGLAGVTSVTGEAVTVVGGTEVTRGTVEQGAVVAVTTIAGPGEVVTTEWS